jgi:hypothetical protein
MRRLAAIALMAIPAPALPPPVPTHPGFVDAPRLQALCSADAASARALCLGYVTGATDALLVPRGRGRRATLCPPADLTAMDAVDAVTRHSRNASGAAGVGAADFVRFALERAWPCPIEGSRAEPGAEE